MKINDLEKDSVRRLKIDDSADGQRLDNFLMTQLKGVPKSRIYKLVRSGEVRINGGRVAVSYRLQLGDEVRIPPQGGIRLVPRILYRDDALIALDKPAGMAVHGGSGISRGVIEQMRLELPECRYMELVHRLDRETSGVLLIALKRRALVGLHAAMRDGKIEKRYLTLVAGRWPNPTQHVKLPLHKRVDDNGEKRVSVRDEGQTAHTIFRRLQSFPPQGDSDPLRAKARVESYADFTLLEAELKTGRTHQIRVHTSHLGFPIAGDDKYGDFVLNRRLVKQGLKRMFLHAAKLVFDHPITGEKMLVEAPLPADLATFLDTLNINAQAI
jgi:23S rRNA pseudouridine955/2504/2580 synthase